MHPHTDRCLALVSHTARDISHRCWSRGSSRADTWTRWKYVLPRASWLGECSADITWPVWYIPPSWSSAEDRLNANSSIVHAAELAFKVTSQQQLFLNNSHIPLVVHQTWRTADPTAWPDRIRASVLGKWIPMAMGDGSLPGPEMAW